jgi:hypothetical protein
MYPCVVTAAGIDVWIKRLLGAARLLGVLRLVMRAEGVGCRFATNATILLRELGRLRPHRSSGFMRPPLYVIQTGCPRSTSWKSGAN